MTNLDSILKSRDTILSTNVHLVKAMLVLVVMYGCESWTIKTAEPLRIDTFELGVGEDSWESLDCKEIQPVCPKGDQSPVFTGRTDVEAATPILWPPDVKSWLIWKDPDAGKDRGQEEKWTTEDEMVGWHHQVKRHGFGWTLGLVHTREAWRAAVHGVAKSWTRLTELNWTEFLAYVPKFKYVFTKNLNLSVTGTYFSLLKQEVSRCP